MRAARRGVLLLGACGRLCGADLIPPGQRCSEVGGQCRPSPGAEVRLDIEPTPWQPPNSSGSRLARRRRLDEGGACLITTDLSGNGTYLTSGGNESIAVDPDKIHPMPPPEDVPKMSKWAMVIVEVEGSTIECEDAREVEFDDGCDEYYAGDGCDWTADWSCPDQPQGTEGNASDDGSDGFMCCCTRGYWTMKAQLQTLTASRSCEDGEVVDWEITCGLTNVDGEWVSQVCCITGNGTEEIVENKAQRFGGALFRSRRAGGPAASIGGVLEAASLALVVLLVVALAGRFGVRGHASGAPAEQLGDETEMVRLPVRAAGSETG